MPSSLASGCHEKDELRVHVGRWCPIAYLICEPHRFSMPPKRICLPVMAASTVEVKVAIVVVSLWLL